MTPSAGLSSFFQLNDTPSICTTLEIGSSIGLILVFNLISEVELKFGAETSPAAVREVPLSNCKLSLRNSAVTVSDPALIFLI